MSNAIQNKLLHYEVPAPDGVWDRIAASLDETLSPALAEKLYQYEQLPAPSVWQNISNQLERAPAEKSRMISVFSRYRTPLRYSGAAAILIFLTVLSSLFISKKTESEVPAETVTSNTPVKEDTVRIPKNSSNSNENAVVVSRAGSKAPENLNAAATSDRRSKRAETARSISIAESYAPKRPQTQPVAASSFTADKYMIYSDGDGNAVRLPKKIFSAFACPTGDADCKQRLQMLRERFAESAVTADFTGLLEILKSLQENQ